MTPARRLVPALMLPMLVGASDPPPPLPIREVPADGRVTVTVDGHAIPARIGPGLPTFLYLPRAGRGAVRRRREDRRWRV